MRHSTQGNYFGGFYRDPRFPLVKASCCFQASATPFSAQCSTLAREVGINLPAMVHACLLRWWHIDCHGSFIVASCVGPHGPRFHPGLSAALQWAISCSALLNSISAQCWLLQFSSARGHLHDMAFDGMIQA